jgi:hypothetical protein
MCKFKTFSKKVQTHVAKIGAKWRVLLYSAPVVGLFLPTIAHAANKLTDLVVQGGKSVGGAAVNATAAGVQGIVQAGAETAGSLAVWIFVANQLSKIFADLFSGIFLFLINFLIGVSQYNSFLGANVVTIGWAVTRDIANMFLVVALLVIAFATILNINSYQASNLLKEFFFAAILVNFSKMICGLMIDAAQVVMMTFVSGYSETAAGNFVKLFQVDKWLQLALGTAKDQAPGLTGTSGSVVNTVASAATWIASSDFFTGIATNIFTAIISFIGILAILSLDIILVVRIVTIWFLIVAAPIAFVAKVLPVTKGFSSQWWSAFMKQLIAGPLVAFIVWISLASIAVSDNAFDLTKEARQKDALFAEANNTPSSKGQVAATKIAQWENLALFFIPIVIFIMGAKWAVGVAGGAAKSITGFANKKLTGYATGGLRAFQKQAIGKGEFSVMTQAKKGWTGEGGFTTAAIGGAGGALLGAVGGQKISAAMSGVVGEDARARLRDNRKNVAIAASKLGIGDLGHKRHEVHNADADAHRQRHLGDEQFEKDMRAAENISDVEEKAKAIEKAKALRTISQKKAAEIISKVEDKQKEIFKADGLLDDASILEKLKHDAHGGHVSEAALTVGKKLIEDSYTKKAAIEMSARKTAFFAKRDEELTAASVRGASEEEIKGIREKYKWDTAKNNAEEFDIEQSKGGEKREATRLMNKYTETPADYKKKVDEAKAKDDLRTSQQAAIKTAEENRAAARIQSEKEGVANTALRASTTTVENNYNVAVQGNPGGHAAAQTAMSRDISSSVLQAKQSGATDAEIKVSLSHAMQIIPPKDRPSFTASLKSNLGAGNPLSSFVDEALAGLEKVKGQNAVDRLEDRRSRRDGQGSDYTLKDLGGVPSSSGNIRLAPPAIAELVEAIKHDPEILARFNSTTSAHPDVQRAITHALSDAGVATKIAADMSKYMGDKQEAVARAKNIGRALQASDDPALQARGATLHQLI